MNPWPISSTALGPTTNGIDKPSNSAVHWKEFVRQPPGILGQPRPVVPVANASGSRSFVISTVRIIPATLGIQALAQSEEAILAALPPLDRWRWLAKHNKLEFVFSVVAAIVAIVAITVSAFHLMPPILSTLSWSVMAQEIIPPTAVSDDNLAWAVLILLAITLLWCLGILTFSHKTGIVKFAK